MVARNGLAALFLLLASLASPSGPTVKFVDVAAEAGITFRHENGASPEKLMTETFGSGVAWLDFDDDGWLDLFFANGADLARAQPLPATSSTAIWETEPSSTSPARRARRAAASSLPGSLSATMTTTGGRTFTSPVTAGTSCNHWLALRARGRESNRLGFGTRVRVVSGGRRQLREIWSAGSYLSGNDVRLYLGLGRENRASRIEILWPSGKTRILENVAAGQNLTVDEDK